MAEETIMPRVIKDVFSSKKLEIMTEELDRRFAGLHLRDLPECQAAIDVLNRYAGVASQHYADGFRLQQERGEE